MLTLSSWLGNEIIAETCWGHHWEARVGLLILSLNGILVAANSRDGAGEKQVPPLRQVQGRDDTS
jgi:hypothetical protein